MEGSLYHSEFSDPELSVFMWTRWKARCTIRNSPTPNYLSLYRRDGRLAVPFGILRPRTICLYVDEMEGSLYHSEFSDPELSVFMWTRWKARCTIRNSPTPNYLSLYRRDGRLAVPFGILRPRTICLYIDEMAGPLYHSEFSDPELSVFMWTRWKARCTIRNSPTPNYLSLCGQDGRLAVPFGILRPRTICLYVDEMEGSLYHLEFSDPELSVFI